MDVVIYLVAAAILVVLITFAVKIRSRTAEVADHEDHQNVIARVAAPPRMAEDRGAGMPRRRRGLDRMVAQRRAQRDAVEIENIAVEVDEEEEEDERPQAEERPQATGKVGAKKQRKLEEKQARRAQREAEMEEREERKRIQELREQERKKEEEKERLKEQKEEEEQRHAKEEQERKEEEEYQKLKTSFIVEEQGEAEELTEQESRNLLQEFIQYVKDTKVVLLEDLASHFEMRTQDAITRLQDLIAEGSVTGVIDDRGKFIFITPEEMNAVAQFIKQRGRVSISELVQASNMLINLSSEINTTS
ncbi:DDRGK domain-containing protein 1 isoform X1 [Tachysurus fulvidraco]|uniref:DDRGK domain-containing protein 1 isoform X1 n=1 Tax=Tachysurus fulvidraco TaxID=1234273 RepID=UPI000F4D5D71|nr:DDRGK domain-containing protein 1 isoform X1 [Tachysurus fulvidraco]